MQSLPSPFNACIFGASGGIGSAIAQLLAGRGDVGHLLKGSRAPAVSPNSFFFDLEDEATIESAALRCKEAGPLHLVIIATGLLQDRVISPEKSYRSQSAAAYSRAFAINTIGPALIGKHFLPLLSRAEPCIFAALSARVGSISDNRLGGWHAYRASKAALNMIMRNFAIEFGRTNPAAIISTLHPGTVDTALSRPFQGNVGEGQLKSPDASARALLAVLDALTPADSGQMFAWDGQRIAF